MSQQNARTIRKNKSRIKYIQNHLIKWGKENYSPFPWRSIESDFHALIAEILLQRTRAEQVVPVFERFCREFPTPASLKAASVGRIWKLITPLGLHWRAERLHAMAKYLTEKHPASIPVEMDKLLKIPSVGPYAASSFLSLHKRIFFPIIDSNVVRFYGRIFGFKTDPETRRKKWFFHIADTLTPKRKFRDYNYALLDFTRKICRTKPVCNDCIFLKQCKWSRNQ